VQANLLEQRDQQSKAAGMKASPSTIETQFGIVIVETSCQAA
jgi:hypothetical protein